jgi:hypothetical protein
MQLLCDTMYARKLIISRLPEIQVAKVVCAEPNRECYARSCKTCKDKISYSLEAASVGFDVRYMLWNRKKDGQFVSTVLSEVRPKSGYILFFPSKSYVTVIYLYLNLTVSRLFT